MESYYCHLHDIPFIPVLKIVLTHKYNTSIMKYIKSNSIVVM